VGELGCASCGSDVSCRFVPHRRFSPCAVEPRSTFRPTRAIQIFDFQRWAPEPRGITVTGSEPASDGEPTISPRRAHSGGRSWSPKRPSTEPVTRRRGGPRAPVPVAPDFRLESSRPPCGETERRPDSSASPPMPLASTALAEAFASLRPTHRHIGLCNPHDPRTRPALFAPRLLQPACACRKHTVISLAFALARATKMKPDCVTLRPRLLPP
jgi:hypothetical protein